MAYKYELYLSSYPPINHDSLHIPLGIANGKHLPSLEKISEASLVAFCDIDKAKAQLAAETYGSDDSKVYEDYRERTNMNYIYRLIRQ